MCVGVCMLVCVCVCMYIYIYIYMYVYLLIHIYVYIHIHICMYITSNTCALYDTQIHMRTLSRLLAEAGHASSSFVTSSSPRVLDAA